MTVAENETPDMLAAALAAFDAGLCVVRAHTDGTKRPLGEWKQYQSQRPSRQQVHDWFKDGWPAMGAVCGSVSGDLEMLELEGRFVTENGTAAFATACRKAGLELLLKRLVNGLLAVSPSDGRHFVYRCTDPVDGNTKLAMRDALPADGDDDPKTLIETRGEGGFIMLAPSHGPTHPSGKPWTIRNGGYDSIPIITAEERRALFDVARSFGSVTPKARPAPTPAGRPPTIARSSHVGESWMDSVVDHLKASVDMRSLLEHYGWQYEYTDRHGRDMLKRPHKNTDGISGSINESRRLIVFSTSTGFEAYSGGAGKATPTYDQLDVIAMYEHGGDRLEAGRRVAETTGIMDAWKRQRDAETVALVAGKPQAQPNVDPETGEITGPPQPEADTLWEERPVLAHILQAARSRMVGPYAVLGCVLAYVAATTPPSTCLPPIVGSYAPMSVYIALRARSGGGKSSPAACANDLMPPMPIGCVGPLPLGSGEGLVDAFMEMVESDGGGKKMVKKQTRHGALFMLDEGQMLTEIGSRKGSTILPVLRTAWSGGDPGQANASIETRRSLRSGSYHVGLVSLWQDGSGAQLIRDADGGTPQRFVWLPTTDPGATKQRPPWPGQLDWQPPVNVRVGDAWQRSPLELHPDIEEEILDRHMGANLHGTIEIDPLDAHRMLNKEKVAGCLALLDGRRNIDLDDWRIAERILTISDQQRDWIISESRRLTASQVAADISKAVLKETAVEKSAAERALRNAAKTAWRCATTSPDGAKRRDIARRIAGRDRAYVTVDDAIAEALKLRWIEGNDDVGFRQGEAQPA